MKTLYNYVMESSEGSFDKYVSSFNDLIKVENLKELAEIEGLEEFLSAIIDDANYRPKELFIYSNGKKYFKIPYAYLESIIKVIDTGKYPQFKLNQYGGKKVKVSLKGYGEIFETGSGSIGRVSIKNQEQAPVVVWNKYVEEMDSFDLNNEEYIRNLVKDLSSDFDTEWITTFQKQIELISSYIKSIGGNPLNYKLTRYGEGKLGNAYKKFVESYIKTISNNEGRKDNYDPSDVILYLADDENEIINKLNSYKITSSEDAIKFHKVFIEDLFKLNKLQGISLKKIAGNKSGVYELFNIGSNVRISEITKFRIESTDKNVAVYCKGMFKLDNMTDVEGDEIGSEKEIKLTLRSFGSAKGGNQVAMDATLTGGKNPALGKCPKREWTEILGISKNDSVKLDRCVNIFKKYLEKENIGQIKKVLTDMIKSAIKEGPNCFPFVLLH